MPRGTKILLPLALLVFVIIVVFYIRSNPPEARKGRPSSGPQIVVDVKSLKAEPYTVLIDSFGVVEPTTQSELVAQVGGQITFVSPKFRNGGFFNKGDVLVRIDPRDFQADLYIARANVASAQRALLEEEASVRQAKLDWEGLRSAQTPNALALREPQLAEMKALLESSKAQLTIAELAVERTEITAPYNGRVRVQSADFGQVVAANTTIATIYATDSVEIRLPIYNSDIELVDLPEQTSDSVESQYLPSRITSSLTNNQNWPAQVVRTEGAIDTASQQLNVVARIDDPFNVNEHPGTLIKIGQYVSAEIKGRTLENAIVIPNSAIYQGSYVYIVEDDLLLRKEVSIRWQNSKESLISDGLEKNDKLVLTSLGQVSSGTKVRINGDKPRRKKPKNPNVGGTQARPAQRGNAQ